MIPMQCSWAVAIIVIFVLGTAVSLFAAARGPAESRLAGLVQAGTTIAIAIVVIHNVYWERNIGALGGWTALYTFPAFLICFPISITLAMGFAIRGRRNKLDGTNKSLGSNH